MPDEIGEIDLSDFGLDDSDDDAPVSTAEPSSEGIPANLMAALGLEGFEAPAVEANGQSELHLMDGMEAMNMLLGHGTDTPEPPTASPQADPQNYNTPMLQHLERQTTAPSTGFGLLEQILLEVSRLNLEIAGLRQQLSILGALGPSVLSSAQGAQKTAAAAPAVEGDASPTADAPPVRRRRGRPRKEDETEIIIE